MSLPRLELDFAAEPRASRLPGIALLVLSLALSAWLGERYRVAQLAIERAGIAQGLAAAIRPAAAQKKGLDEDFKEAEAVMRQLALPWGAMIGAVESASIPEIALLQLAPDARERQLRLTAEAPGERAMLDYLRRLAAEPVLAEVHLAQHQVVQEDPRRPIQFTVLARLKDPR